MKFFDEKKLFHMWLGSKPGLNQFLMNFPSLMYPAGPGHTLAPQASQNAESGARGAPQDLQTDAPGAASFCHGCSPRSRPGVF